MWEGLDPRYLCEMQLMKLMANIFISFIGGGVLGLPFAFMRAGIFEGTFIMIAVSVLSVKAMLLLIECKEKYKIHVNPTLSSVKVSKGQKYNMVNQSDDNNSDDDSDNGKSSKTSSQRSSRSSSPDRKEIEKITYGDVGQAAMPRCGRILVDFAILTSQIGFCCAYLLFIVKNLETSHPDVSRKFFLAWMLPACFMFTLIRDLKKLSTWTLLAQGLQVSAFIIVVDFDFENSHLIELGNRKEIDFYQLPFFISIAVYCFEGAGMILHLEQSVVERYKSSFKTIFVRVITAITILYVFFGVSGYLSYGEETRDVITFNLDQSDVGWIHWSVFVRVFLCSSLFLTYPLMMFPVTNILKRRISEICGCSPENYAMFLLMRLALVSLTGSIILVVPNFGQVMEIIGATICTHLAFTLPALFHYRMPTKIPLTKSELTWDIGLIITGLFTFVICTYKAVNDLREGFKSEL